jgi:hypothetical protein
VSFTTDILIGSIPDLPAYAYTINGTAYGIATGDYYLYDSTDSRSILAQIVADAATEGITGFAAFLTEAGYVRFTATDSFNFAWTDSDFRDLLGATAGTGASTDWTATNKSPLYWSPAAPGTPTDSPANVQGAPYYDGQFTMSPSGATSMLTRHNTQTRQGWTWRMIPQSRIWTTDITGLGGEFRRFYDVCLSLRYRYKHYTSVSEGTTSTAMSFGGSTLGPYKLRKPIDGWWNRQVSHADTQTSISFDVIKVGEYS